MKHTLIKRALAAFVLLLAVCASANAGGSADGNTKNKAGLSLMDAIEQTAEKITADLPKGSRRVAIVAFESANDKLSDYIMEELTGALFDRNIEVADRQNLEYVYKELKLQMSGDVSDESAKSIGKFLAADMVITGQLLDLDGMYRYRTSAINVETAVRASVTRLDVRSDKATQRMMTAIANQKTTVKVAKYGVSEDKAPQTAGTFLDRGITFAKEGKYEEALASFNEAIRLDPNMAAAYFNRGLIFMRKTGVMYALTYYIEKSPAGYNEADIEKALTDFNEAIRLDTNGDFVYFCRAEIYGNKRDYAKAIADMTQAFRLSPRPPLVYGEYLALMYQSIGNRAKEIEELTQIIRSFDSRIDDPLLTRYSVYRGEAYMALKDYDKAIDDFSHVIKLNPDFGRAYSGRSRAYILKREYDKAISDLNHFIRLNPVAGAYYDRGHLYLLKEDYDKAIMDFEAMLKMDLSATTFRLADVNSALAGAYTKRALAYRIKGDLNREIADWEAVLRINPNDADAKRDLEEAKRKRGR